MNGNTLAIIDTLAKNINDNSANMERAESLVQSAENKLRSRIVEYRDNGDTLPVANAGYIAGNGAILCESCVKGIREGYLDGTDKLRGRVDSPMHCEDCEALLPLELTEHGYTYLADAIMRYLIEPSKHDRPKVLRSWVIYYDHRRSIVDTIARYWNDGEPVNANTRGIVRALMAARGIF